jgi:hypothetical protein
MSKLEDASIRYIQQKTPLVPTNLIESSRAEYNSGHDYYQICYDGVQIYAKQGILNRATNYEPEITRSYVRLDDISDILLRRRDKFVNRLQDIVDKVEDQLISSGTIQAKEYSINRLVDFLDGAR